MTVESKRTGIEIKLRSTFEFTNPEMLAAWGSWCPDGMFFLGPTQEPVL